jgi:hypothetical protein
MGTTVPGIASTRGFIALSLVRSFRLVHTRLKAERAELWKEIQQRKEDQNERVVTIERLENGLALLAYIIVRDGPVYAPLFKKLRARA